MAKKKYGASDGDTGISGEGYSSSLSVAAGALSDALEPGIYRGSAAGLSRRIRGEVRRFLRSTDKSRSEILKSGNNLHIIEENTSSSVSALRKARGVTLSGGEPVVFRAAMLYIDRKAMPGLDKVSCRAFGDAVCMCSELCYCDMSSIGTMLCAALLMKAANISGERSDDGTLHGIISSLRAASSFKFGVCLSHCEAEKLLNLDPSGDYPLMTEMTKNMYREEISRAARLSGKSDRDIASCALDKARAADREKRISGKSLSPTEQSLLERRRHIGKHILHEPQGHGGGVYFVLLASLTALFVTQLTLITPLGLLALFPIWEAVKAVLDTVFSRIFASRPLPEIDLDAFCEKSERGVGVLTVITSLLSGEKSDAELFSRLERLYLSSRLPEKCSAYFGILGDFPDSKTESSADDKRVLEYARKSISLLNEKYGRHFVLFVRKRTYCESEGVYMGWERKRGAVIELVKFLRGYGGTSFSEYPDFLPCAEIRYAVTLDSDTNVGIGALSHLVGKALHPLCRPVTDENKGIVTEGYGIMQPCASPTLSSARRTLFSRLMCGEGGIDLYSGARFDLYQTLFGRGIFCGKGIFDVDAFLKTVIKPGVFPEGYILSHDILEGSRLRCAAVSDIVFTDSFPKNPLSYLKRAHRWIRGDIQNAAFIGGGTADGLSRFELFDNVRRALVPVFSFAAVISCIFAKSDLLLFAALSPYTVPFLLDVLSGILSLNIASAARRYFSSGVCERVWQSLLRTMYLICMLPKTALVTMGAVSVSLYRMAVSKKGLLEWQTAAQSDLGDGSLLCYASKHLACAAIGFAVFLMSGEGMLRLISFGWFLFPAIAYLSSRPSYSRRSADKDSSADGILRGYAYDIWRFFSDRVTEGESFLPPDNLQLFPTEKVAHRTSPTNIGLYLASIVAAADFGFIDAHVLCERLSHTLDTVEALPKCHGNLYNWYDTEKAEVLEPRFISSVDCGNFVACMIAARNGACDYISSCPRLGDEIKRLDGLIAESDFSVFYDSDRNLFSVGLHESGGELSMDNSYYDLYMSEARTMSYIAVANADVPPEHRAALSRVLISSGGYIGLASWSGTAFEYFMPCLFLPVSEGSLESEALAFAFAMQRKSCVKTPHGDIFGISESGYFAFDSDMNYAYRAFGVPRLAVSVGRGDSVISPYSSFLFLPQGKSIVMRNLERLKRCGMYGEYGFYEALDFTPSRVGKSPCIVKSFMSHHLGMSLLAICNSVFGGKMRRRFMQNPVMASAAELLDEKIPVGAVIRKPRRGASIAKPPRYPEKVEGVREEFHTLDKPFVGALSVGKTSLAVSSSGHMHLVRDGTSVFDCSREKYLCTRSVFVFAEDEKRAVSVSPLPFTDRPDAREVFSFSPSMRCGEFVYRADYGKLSLVCRETVSDGLLRIRLETDSKDEIPCAFFGLPLLSSEKKHFSHPAFSALAVEASFDGERGILVFSRRPYGDEKPMYLAVGLSDGKAPFSFDTRTEDIFGTQISSDGFFDIMKHSPKNNVGACVSPGMLIMTAVSESSPAELLCAFSESEVEAKEGVLAARRRSFDSDRSIAAESYARLFIAACGTEDKRFSNVCSSLFRDAFFGKGDTVENAGEKPFSTGVYGDLWRYGISGDIPIALLMLPSAAFMHEVGIFMSAARLAWLLGMKIDLCIIYSEVSGYSSPFRNALEELAQSLSLGGYIGGRRDGGIFLISSEDNCNTLESCAGAVYVINSARAIERIGSDGHISRAAIPKTLSGGKPKITSEGGICVAGGLFTEEGFTVQKSGRQFAAPYSHVLAGRNISSLITQDSLGFTFLGNSSEKRLAGGLCDLYSRPEGERLFLTADGEIFDLCAMSEEVRYFPGGGIYRGSAFGYGFEISVFVCEKYRAKVVDVVLTRDEESAKEPGSAELCMVVKPVMGSAARSADVIGGSAADGILLRAAGGTVRFRPKVTEEGSVFTNLCGFLTLMKSPQSAEIKVGTDRGLLLGGTPTGESDIAFVSASAAVGSYRFVIGAYRDGGREYNSMMSTLLREGEKESAHLFGMSLTSEDIRLCGAVTDTARAMSELFCKYLPYQNAASRFIGRCGYYQAGGAYGFRDGLQDTLCLMQSRRLIRDARAHLLRSAARQFEDGSVLHWWHDVRGNDGTVCRGSRSRCSDDYLWLVYAVSEYVMYTGDRAVLDVKVPYIEGEELSSGESERYISARLTERRESLFCHLERAVRRGMTHTGPHGLPLIGSCDWSDGLNKVGKEGKGESVWLAMFLRIVLDGRHFSHLCRLCGRDSSEYEGFSEKLCENIRASAVDRSGKYFIRGFFDDGTPFGSSENESCKIDLLPQAFYPLTENPEVELMYSALCESYRRLYDGKFRLTSLFTPPFTGREDHDTGYIRGYAPGFRENGGQYTHAAIWGAMGMFEAARREKDGVRRRELISMGEDIYISINPILRTSGAFGEAIRDAYKAEPYALCADVYTNPEHRGRGGWSLYTGSAGWYKTVMLKYVFGVELYDILTDTPRLSVDTSALPFARELDGCVLDIDLGEGSAAVAYSLREDKSVKVKVSHRGRLEIEVK